MTSQLGIIVLILVGATAGFVAALRAYITTVTKFEVPLSHEDTRRVFFLWLLLSVAMISAFGIPSKVIEYFGDPIPRSWAITPLIMGSGITVLFFKREWRAFLERFSSGRPR